jgi:malate dehydrogenase (oxaloacetate-decarboxylating)
VIFGAGAAGLGVTRQIKAQLAEEGVGPDRQAEVVAVLDRSGLVIDDGRIRDPYKRTFAWPAALAQKHGVDGANGRSLHDVVRAWRPTMLIGLSGLRGAFDERVVREMAAHVERPVIFPSSNPSANSEAQPADLYAWTDCRCLVATGSPFRDVDCGGRRFRVGQGNNVFIFPGLGLGALAVRARKVTDGMTNAASKMLASLVTPEERAEGLLFPSVTRLQSVSFAVAIAVAREAVRAGVADWPEGEIEQAVSQARWDPDYPVYESS